MAISRVPGAALLSDLDRQGIDLQFTTSGNALVYMDFANFHLGINDPSPNHPLSVVGNVLVTTGALLTSANISYDIGNVSNWWNTVYANSIVSESLSTNSLSIAGNIAITGNATSGIIRADELYDSNNRVLTTNTTISATGDVTGSGTYSNIVLTISNNGVTAGTYGSGDDEFPDRIPKITVDSKGLITNISNITLSQIGNVSFVDKTITVSGNLIIYASGGTISANGAIISNIGTPVNGNDAVTLDYVTSLINASGSSIASDNSSIVVIDNGVNSAVITTTVDGTIISNSSASGIEFYNTVNIGNLTIDDSTISSNGNIILEALGSGIVQFPGNAAVQLPSGTDSTRPPYPDIGYTRYNTERDSLEVWDGSNWISPGESLLTSQIVTPDGTSNVYSLSSNVASASSLFVSINGTLQQSTTAYTIINNNQIQFTETPLTTDIIEIRILNTATTTITGLQNNDAAIQLDIANVNVTGNLLPTANITYDLGSDTLRWRDIYLAGNTINLGGMTLKNDGGIFKAMMGNIASKLQAEDPVDNADVVTLGYLNSELSSLDSSIITLDDSSISIVDDGVSAGNIVVAVDGANIATFGNDAIAFNRTSTVSGNLIVTNEVLAGNLSGVNITGLLLTPDQYNVTGLGNLSTGTWSANTIAVNKGGTGATTSAEALNNLLPSGEQTGYVLKTSGPGTYYWSGESGGGGATVGQQLTTTRQANTATSGQTVFTLVSGITYTPGTGQLRVYINGVRQFPSEYTETASNVYTLTSGVAAGDIVFAEIDNFSTFNNYANLTYASNVGNVSASGLTVQSAIENLENNKAPLSSPVFTGVVTTTGNATVGGALTVSGNLYVNGNVTYINANNINLNDSLIYLADDNPSDSIDIGFVSAFTSNVRYQHTGFVRDATDGVWKLFANVVAEPTTTIDFTNATYANLQVGNIAGTITTASQPNITTVGTLGSLAVTGNVTVSGNVKLSAAGWSVRETGTKLYFAYNGVNKMSLDTGGNLVVTGDVTAFGTIT